MLNPYSTPPCLCALLQTPPPGARVQIERVIEVTSSRLHDNILTLGVEWDDEPRVLC
jgi:hypothetical protein